MSDQVEAAEKKESNEIVSPEGFVLSAGDVELFILLYAFRFLRREQIGALTGRPPRRLHRRLLKLIENGYLTLFGFPSKMMIVHIPAILAIAIRDNEIDLSDWREGRKLQRYG